MSPCLFFVPIRVGLRQVLVDVPRPAQFLLRIGSPPFKRNGEAPFRGLLLFRLFQLTLAPLHQRAVTGSVWVAGAKPDPGHRETPLSNRSNRYRRSLHGDPSRREPV